MSRLAITFPILRVIGGLCFLLAGLAYYVGVTLSVSAALVFVAAGVVVIVLAIAGHGIRAGDVAIFILGILTLGAVLTPGIASPGPGTPAEVTYTAASSAVAVHNVTLLANTDVGNVNIGYTAKAGVAYEINFTRTTAFPFWTFTGQSPSTSLTNETTGDILVLNATARDYDISVLLSREYALTIKASTGTGNVNVRTDASQSLGTVRLQTGTGNVDANLTSASLASADLQTGTGNVRLDSAHLTSSGTNRTVVLHTGTGSVNMDVKLVSGTAASVVAHSGLGSVSYTLPGFSVASQSSKSNLLATAGDSGAAANSFSFSLTTGTGSVTADAQFLKA